MVNFPNTPDRRILNNSVGNSFEMIRFLELLNEASKFNLEIFQTSKLDNRIVVKKKDDILGDLESSKEYFIDGHIDLEGDSISIPLGGLNINGYNFDNSGLYSSHENHVLFKNSGTGAAGYLRCRNIFLNSSGSGAKIFDLHNDSGQGSVELVNCNLGQFGFDPTSSLGELSNYRLFRLDGCAVILAIDGVTFSNSMSGGVTITDTIGLLLPATHTLLKEGTSLVIDGNVSSNMNFNSVDDLTKFCDFLPSVFTRDSSFNLSNFRTTAIDAIPNIEASNVKARFENCRGVNDTYIGGEWVLTSEVDTIISTAGVFVKLEGVTDYFEMQHFFNNTNNAFVYESDQTVNVKVLSIVGISGTNNNQVRVQIRLWDDSASSYVVLSTTNNQTLSNGLSNNRSENITTQAVTQIDQNDRIEIWIANMSTNSDVRALINSKCVVSER